MYILLYYGLGLSTRINENKNKDCYESPAIYFNLMSLICYAVYIINSTFNLVTEIIK